MARGISRVGFPAPRKDDLRAAALMQKSNVKRLLNTNMCYGAPLFWWLGLGL